MKEEMPHNISTLIAYRSAMTHVNQSSPTKTMLKAPLIDMKVPEFDWINNRKLSDLTSLAFS